MDRKKVLSLREKTFVMDRKEFCSGQKIALSWTEKSFVCSGQKIALPWTEKVLSLTEKESCHRQKGKFCHGRKKFCHGQKRVLS